MSDFFVSPLGNMGNVCSIAALQVRIAQLELKIARLELTNAQLRAELHLPSTFAQGACSICLEDLKPGWLARTPCWHIYHIDCALQIMKYYNRCPICRKNIQCCSKIFVLSVS